MIILKQLFFTILAAGILSYSQITAQSGIEFFHGSFEEAVELAQKEHKLIFMDAYASWCGPCKRMAKLIFTQKEVGDFFNTHFINLKIDMEKGEGPQLARKYKVRAYPTLLFIDETGEIVKMQRGALSAENFIALGKASLNTYDKSKDYTTDYQNGNRDPNFLKAYAYALKTSARPTLKIANEYLKTQQQLDSEDNLNFIFDFATEADCSIFDKLIQYKDELIKMKDEEVFKTQVKKACDATLKKAVEYKTPKLLAEAKKQMKAAMPGYARKYNLLANIRYATLKENAPAVAKYTNKYIKKYARKDATRIHEYAQSFYQKMTNKKALAHAEKWAKIAYKLNPTVEYGLTYVKLLRKNGKISKADLLANKIKNLP